MLKIFVKKMINGGGGGGIIRIFEQAKTHEDFSLNKKYF
jgi:hypothetical protein